MGVGSEGMPVDPLADDGHEQASAMRGPAVQVRGTGDHERGITAHDAPGDGGDLVEAQRDHGSIMCGPRPHGLLPRT